MYGLVRVFSKVLSKPPGCCSHMTCHITSATSILRHLPCKPLRIEEDAVAIHHIKRSLSIADFVTFGNAALGILAILSLTQGPGERTLAIAMLLVITAAGCDLLDGMLARKFGSSPWGIGFDACADAISFGFAPAGAILLWSHNNAFGWAPAGCMAVAVVVRLLRFVRTRPAKHFQGMPSPFGALTVYSLLLMTPPVWWSTLPLFFVAALMISEIPFPKPTGRSSVILLFSLWLAAIAGAGILAAMN